MPQLFYGQWVPQVSGTTENLNDVFAVTENLVFAVGNNGTILKTTDGGSTWVQKTSGTTQNLTKVQFANQNVGFVIGFNGVLLKTINGGDNWNLTTTNISTNLYGLSVINENIFIISGLNGLINKTTDGGITFSVLGIPENNIVSKIQFYGQLVGFAQVGDYEINLLFTQTNNKLYKTLNGGLSWNLVTDSIDTFYFVNENLGFISKVDNHSINKTINGGQDFNYIAQSNINEKDIFSVNGNTIWDLGNSLSLCSCDYFCIGKKEIVDFTVIQETPSCKNIFFGGDRFNSINFFNETVGYTVGFTGVIHKNNTGLNESLSNLRFEKSKFFTISPNPTNEQLNVSFDNIQFESIKIEISDSLGKKVLSNFYQPIEIIKIDTKSFSKGIYFLTVSTAEVKQTQKLIIN